MPPTCRLSQAGSVWLQAPQAESQAECFADFAYLASVQAARRGFCDIFLEFYHLSVRHHAGTAGGVLGGVFCRFSLSCFDLGGKAGFLRYFIRDLPSIRSGTMQAPQAESQAECFAAFPYPASIQAARRDFCQTFLEIFQAEAIADLCLCCLIRLPLDRRECCSDCSPPATASLYRHGNRCP